MFLKTRIIVIILSLSIGLLYSKYNELTRPMPAPVINLHEYWGPYDAADYIENNKTTLVKINYEIAPINTLKTQLKQGINLHDPLEGITGNEYGMNSQIFKQYLDYWQNQYLNLWLARVHYFNLIPHFVTNIHGLDIHYCHTKFVRFDGDENEYKILPILILHGWPNTFRDFIEFTHKLLIFNNNTNIRYELVIPSLPGFIYSDAACKPGLGPVEISVIMRNLMLRLGYERFYVQGGDLGAIIGSHIATLFPENVIGYHSNMCTILTPLSLMKSVVASIFPSYFIEKSLQKYMNPITDRIKLLLQSTGFLHLQATKPDTIGTILSQNPIGWAAYVLEKFIQYPSNITKEEIFDTIMLYYVTDSIGTSVRIHTEAFSAKQMNYNMDRVPTSVPTGCTRFKNGFGHMLDWQLKEKYTNIVHSTWHSQGGHYAAIDVHELFFKDFVEFITIVENLEVINKKRDEF